MMQKENESQVMKLDEINRLLKTVFGLERRLVGRVPLPFGVSLVAVLRRPRG